MVQTPTRYVTQDEFEQLCLEHPDRMIERTAQGELVDVAPIAVLTRIRDRSITQAY